MVTAKGTEAQTENGALISAKRAWRAWVRSDHGERYQDLELRPKRRVPLLALLDE